MAEHDLLWKFWASEQMAWEIFERYIDTDPDNYVTPIWREEYYALAQILKKEWFR